MLHAVIIDDEINGLVSLELLINKFSNSVKIVAKTTDPYEAIHIINNYRPDIVFTDIQMPGKNGFDVINSLTFKDFYLVFTTAYSEFAIKAIKENAFDYLLKPVDVDELNDTVTRIENKIKEKQKGPDIKLLFENLIQSRGTKIPVPTKISIEYIYSQDIVCVEAKSNNSVVYTKEIELPCVKPLRFFEDLLCKGEPAFLRVHNSFIINVNEIARFVKANGGLVVMKNKQQIPVSKNAKTHVLDLLKIKPIDI